MRMSCSCSSCAPHAVVQPWLHAVSGVVLPSQGCPVAQAGLDEDQVGVLSHQVVHALRCVR